MRKSEANGGSRPGEKITPDKLSKFKVVANGSSSERARHLSSSSYDGEPKDTCHLTYLIFYLHGVGHLLPWNFFITATLVSYGVLVRATVINTNYKCVQLYCMLIYIQFGEYFINYQLLNMQLVLYANVCHALHKYCCVLNNILSILKIVYLISLTTIVYINVHGQLLPHPSFASSSTFKQSSSALLCLRVPTPPPSLAEDLMEISRTSLV